jgi:hypothetical protein
MEFTVDGDIAAFSADDLAAKITEGREALDALFALAPEDVTDENLAEAERIAALVASLEEESSKRETAAEERSAKMGALREQFSQHEETGDEDEDDESDDAESDEDEAEAEEEEPVVEASAKAPVKASAKPTARQALAKKVARPKVPAKPTARISITAAADIPDFPTGGEIADLPALAMATINRMKGFAPPAGIKDGQMTSYPVATFRQEFPSDLVIDRNADDMEIIENAARESRLPQGSLTAAGGWCAPSETLYDFCVNQTTEGLLDLPEVEAKRGGLKYTEGPDFSTPYSSSGFTQTEAQAIAGTAKTCYEVTCPTFTETRLDAVGLCIKVPILTNAAYPELVEATIAKSLIAYQHRLSASLITKMVTAAGTAVVTNSVGSTTANSLDSLALVGDTLRQTYRLSFGETLEVVAPFWLKGAVRADLAMRNGVDYLAISDAEIQSFFAVRGMRVQWVYNWQALVEGEEGYPATAQVMVYPAGTFVKARTNVINLNAVYDAAELSVNRYTGLFMEEGVALIKRCYKAKLVTIALSQAGLTGANTNVATFTLT